MAQVTHNGLSVSFVESLDDLVQPVVDYLTNAPAGRDIFEVDHIIVPNAGVRAWLLQKIASNVGVSAIGSDGIAANLNIGYLGALDSLIGRTSINDDPWSVSALTMSVLAVISHSDVVYDDQVERLGGGLRAARAIADQFDRYNARRPSMIVEWEKGNATLAPAVGDVFDGNEHVINTPEIEPADLWQFALWRKVREQVGVPPWPVLIKDVATQIQNGIIPDGLPSRFLVVGLQSLSVRHIEVLRALSHVIEIHVVLVHPSLTLANTWAAQGAALPASVGIAPTRNPNERIDPTVDQLVGAWLRGARETQMLLASQEVAVSIPAVAQRTLPVTLLEAIQQAVSTGVAGTIAFDAEDMSIRMHRTHNLARQVEILRDALLHAFHDIEGLEPHDIVIMCADIEATAPLIEASFARTFIHNGRSVLMPVVVADRSLRHVDDGAQLLHNLVSMVSGRFAASDVLGIATSPLVLREFALGADDVAVWERIVDTAVVRWGASPAHRARKGVDAQQISAHSWSLALERAMLGAVLPDGMPAPEIGNVVPLRDIDASEIDSVTALARIVSVLVELEKATSSAPENPNLRTITDWALLIETALSQLSDPADGEIDNALQVIDQIRDYVRLVDDIIPVRFDHFAMQLLELISEAPGRQPLRTGAITATSMVPLRGVPFKVVCLVGFDEGSVTTGEVEGDDLIERQRFVGDSDPRIDQRRAILDAVCAASHRVVITCNGRSIKDNKEVPLITPFAELLDLCERCGVGNQHGHTDIEHQHPRHFSSIKNFTRGAVLPGIIWSHDAVAKQSVVQQGSSARGAKPTPQLVSAPSDKSLIDIKRFRTLSADPLRLFINDHLSINTWKEQIEEESATIPLELVKKDLTALCADLLAARLAGFDDAYWETVQDSAGMLPIGKYKTATVAMVVGRVNSLQEIAAKWNINLSDPETFDIDIDTKYGTISGSIVLYRSPDGYVAMHPFTRAGFKKIDNEEVALNLLFLAASGYFFEGTVNIGLHGKEKDKCQAWFVELGPDIDQTDAIERLENLIELMAQAESVPLPMFGDTAVKLDVDEEGARKAFATRVKADSYPSSNECLIYGPGPDFTVVYPVKGIERSFFVSLVKALPARDKELEKLRGSIKPPDNSRAQQRYVFV